MAGVAMRTARCVTVTFVLSLIGCGSFGGDEVGNSADPKTASDGGEAGVGSGGDAGANPLAPCTSDPNDLRRFAECAQGGGIYGTWILDRYGMPAFQYELDERNDPRGVRPNSEDIFPLNKKRTDHFHVMG